MAISNTTTDYTGRTVDMYISGPLDSASTAAQSVVYSFGNPSQYIAGVQKLVQRYVISLINSGFIEALMGGVNNNIQSATHIFNLYSWNVILAFKTYQNNNLNQSLDEQLSTVQLTNVAASGDSVNFSAQLITKAGDTVQFVLPLPLN